MTHNNTPQDAQAHYKRIAKAKEILMMQRPYYVNSMFAPKKETSFKPYTGM